MTENERIIMEATLEELEIAENELLYDTDDNKMSDRSQEILLAAIRNFIEAREMYGEDTKPTISDEDWAEAIKYIDSLILLYSGIGMSGMFGLNIMSQLKTRYENGERTQELYDSIMSCE